MESDLPRAYLRDVSHYIDELGTGFTSKQDFMKLEETISELDNNQAVRFLELVRDGIVANAEDHKMVCQNPTGCHQLMQSERAVISLERRIKERRPFVLPLSRSESETPNHPPDHTTARQVLAMKFLLNYAKINVTNDKAAERFLHFLTGKSSDNLYKLWRNPYNKDVFANQKEDLRYVRKLFEDLGAPEIVKMLNNEIDSLEQ